MPFQIQPYMSQSQSISNVRHEGMLSKWTNYASGYKRRWFVLENGILSYYKSQADYPVSCRGSINLRRARIIADPNDKYHFDIVGIDSSIRYHLRADQVSDVKKWVVSLLQAKHSMVGGLPRLLDAQAPSQQQLSPHDAATMLGSSPKPMAPSSSPYRFDERDARFIATIDENSSYSSIDVSDTRLPPHPSTCTSASSSSLLKDHMPLGMAQQGDKIPEAPFTTEELALSANFSKYLESLVEQIADNESQLNALAANIDSASHSELLIAQSRQYRHNCKALFTTTRLIIAATKERERMWDARLQQETHGRALLEESMRTLTLATGVEEDGDGSGHGHHETPPQFTNVSSDEEDQESDDEFFDTFNDVNKIPLSATEPRPRAALERGPSDSDLLVESSTSTIGLSLAPLPRKSSPSALPHGRHSLRTSIVFANDDSHLQSVTPSIIFTPSTPAPGEEGLERTMAAHSATSLPSELDFIAMSLVGYPFAFRQTLPCPMAVDASSVSIWTILKSAIGKDLTRITIPIHFNEPMSMLQRMSEDMEYAFLLDKANEATSSIERLMYVAAFAVSNYSSTENRVSKPFNPLLGETFELVSREHGYRYVSEQVSHHPPMSACFCESKNYTYWSEINVKTHFWGKSFEIVPEGVSHIRLKSSGEHYSWTKVHTIVNNIIMGKPWIDHYGTMTVKNHGTNDYCALDFKATNWRGSNAKKIEGQVFDGAGTHCFDIVGHWNDRLTAVRRFPGPYPPEIVLWTVKPRPSCSAQMYNYTEFAMCLNELTPELERAVCPTDSRLRPDQRAMELGDIDAGAKLKDRLEQKQRLARKERERAISEYEKAQKKKGNSSSLEDMRGSPEEPLYHVPRWFVRNIEQDTQLPQWAYKGGYWEARERGTWDDMPTIFLSDATSPCPSSHSSSS